MALFVVVPGGPVRAEEAAAPANVAEYAKQIQGKLTSVRAPGEQAKSGFPFGHFLKPPPPPPAATEDGPNPEVPIALPGEIKCQGTMNMGGQTVVVMSDGTHKVGDIVSGAKITAISKNEVTFLYRTRVFKLPVR